MRSSGVPHWPDPTSGGSFDKSKLTLQQLGVSSTQLQAAQDVCSHLLPTASSAQRRLAAAQALRFSQCMRGHGVTSFPDPGSGGRIPDPASLGIDQGSPLFQAANQACRAFRPPYMPSNASYSAWARAHGS